MNFSDLIFLLLTSNGALLLHRKIFTFCYIILLILLLGIVRVSNYFQSWIFFSFNCYIFKSVRILNYSLAHHLSALFAIELMIILIVDLFLFRVHIDSYFTSFDLNAVFALGSVIVNMSRSLTTVGKIWTFFALNLRKTVLIIVNEIVLICILLSVLSVIFRQTFDDLQV